MSHARCVACKIRIRVRRPDQALSCPLCGHPLEPVHEFGELVGLRPIAPHPNTKPGTGAMSGALFTERVREALGREDH